MREEAEAIEVWSPSFPRSLKTVWQGHNEQSIGQIRLRYPKPISEILSNTHRKPWTRALMWTIHGHDSFENSKGENAKCCPPLPQAPSIKGDVRLVIPHSHLLGQKWRCVRVERPSAGKSVTNPALESALPTQLNSRRRNGLLSASRTCTVTTTSCRKSMTWSTNCNQLLANLISGPINQKRRKNTNR